MVGVGKKGKESMAKVQDKKSATNPPPELSDDDTDSDSEGSDIPDLEENTGPGGSGGAGDEKNFMVRAKSSLAHSRRCTKIFKLRWRFWQLNVCNY
jgi:hypothetical protein